MNVLQSLTELYNSQDRDSILRDLARRIMTNLEHMKRVTIYDIAELTNSSRTTVWRLVKKLGYESFSDFKFAIQSAASQYTYYNRLLDASKSKPASSLVAEMRNQMAEAERIISENVSAELIEELAQALSCADKIYFFMPFRSSCIYSFQQNLWKSGKETCYSCLIPDMLDAADDLDENSVVIMSTIEFVETIDMTRVFQKVQAAGSTIWLTGHMTSKFSNYVHRQILTVETTPAAWLLAFDCFIITLSEHYRSKYIGS